MPKISVIIPIHGTERYVEKCVRSVMDQTLEDIEILCIDDCSPDDSAKIVEALAAEDSRIRLIRHKHNLGIGGARNTGISEARAPYLASVDSDDFIEPQMLERLWDATEEQTIDVVSCGLTFVDENGSVKKKVTKPNKTVMTGDPQLNIMDLLPPSFCNKLWRTSLFRDNGIMFPIKMYYEDLATTPKALRFANAIRIIKDTLYNYFIREGSITNSYSAQHIIDYFRTYDTLWDFFSAEDLMSRYEDNFFDKIGKSLHYHTNFVSASDMNDADKSQYVRHMLLLKLAYLEYNPKLRDLDIDTLRSLLLNARSREDVDAFTDTATLGLELKKKDEEIESLETKCQKLQQLVTHQEKKIGSQNAEIEALKRHLAETEEARIIYAERVTALEGSTSWRVTSPLRKASLLLKGR